MSKPNHAVYLSHFTPSMMPAQTLEALLVKRESLIERVVKSAIESVKTGGKHHHLFVGPRGIGKTHVISLLHHRLSHNKTIQAKAKIVWMREEEWGVTSFFELVLRILRNLDQAEPSLGIHAALEELYALTVKQAEGVASDLLIKAIAGKTLIILLENLDDLFEQMGDMGQKKWRAFIQNHPQFIMLCTTPALFQGVTSQKSAFYGSFDVEQLDEFSFDEVVELLAKIADYRGDKELVDFINTAEGRARIRAVHHLAQGNPRIYIIFAQFLSKVALDELVQAFMHTLDELTPYYQARMKELSGQQRKILSFLIQYKGAAAVKDIAKACFITQQACSSQLKILKDRRFVQAQDIGRSSFYELREPLMRLCMEVKELRGEPLSLFVDMLRIWYRSEELELWLSNPDTYPSFNKTYIEAAIKALKKDGDPKVRAVLSDFKFAVQGKNYTGMMEMIPELQSIVGKQDVFALTSLMLLAVDRFELTKLPLTKETFNLLDEALILLHDNTQKLTVSSLSPFVGFMNACMVSWKLCALFPLYKQRFYERIFEAMTNEKRECAASLIVLGYRTGLQPSYIDWIQKVMGAAAKKNALGFLEWSQIFLRLTDAMTKGGKREDFLRLPIEERQLLQSYLAKTKTNKV